MQIPTALAQTLQAAATAAAPGAGSVLVSVAVPSAGNYRVSGVIVITGTAETQLVNLRLRQNAAVVGLVLPTVTGFVVPFEFERVEVTAAGNIDLQVVSAATAGSVYTANLVVTRAS